MLAVATALTGQAHGVKHDISTLDGIADQPSIVPVSLNDTRKKREPRDKERKTFYLIASIVEPFIFVTSNHVTYPRFRSDSLMRFTVA